MNEFWTRNCVRSPGLLSWIVLESSRDICDWIYKLTLRLEPDDHIIPSAAIRNLCDSIPTDRDAVGFTTGI
jgi:hypothetical protein